MGETTSLTIECHKPVHKWKYSNNLAVGKIFSSKRLQHCTLDNLYAKETINV